MSGTASAAWLAQSTDAQNLILAFTGNFRPALGEMARALRDLNALNNAWLASVQGAVTALPAGTVIPDQTGLAGAATLVREDLLNVMAEAQAVLTANYAQANLAEYIKIVGPGNV